MSHDLPSSASDIAVTRTERTRSKWLTLSLVGVIMPFASVGLLIVAALVVGDAGDSDGISRAPLANALLAMFLIGTWGGLILIPIGGIGWVVTADGWGDRFARLARVGLVMIPTFLVLSFALAFATQDGTDVDGKATAAIVMAAFAPVGVLVAVIGFIGKRRYDRRAVRDEE